MSGRSSTPALLTVHAIRADLKKLASTVDSMSVTVEEFQHSPSEYSIRDAQGLAKSCSVLDGRLHEQFGELERIRGKVTDAIKVNIHSNNISNSQSQKVLRLN